MSRDQPPGVPPDLASFRDEQVIDMIVRQEGVGASLLFGGAAWGVARLAPQVLAERAKMPMDEAVRLAAAFELAYRVRDQRAAPRPNLDTGSTALAWLSDRATMLDQEEAWLLSLDVEHKLLGARLLAVGTRANVALDVTTVLRHALEMGAFSFILVHNHVEGLSVPSERDLEFTVELREGAFAIGMMLVDHFLTTRDRKIVSVVEYMKRLARKAARKPKGTPAKKRA
jgi:DNA repair protein RadC